MLAELVVWVVMCIDRDREIFRSVYEFSSGDMVGVKVDGTEVDSWSRRTVVLQRTAALWKIVHDHLSFPLAMDGTNRAVTDLQP